MSNQPLSENSQAESSATNRQAQGTKMADGWAVYKRLLSYSARYWSLFVMAVLGMTLFAVANSAFMWLMKPLLDSSFVEKHPTVMAWIPYAIIVLFIMRGGGSFIGAYFMAGISQRVVLRMRNQVFRHYMHLPASYFDTSSSGKLLTKLTFHVEQVAAAASTAISTVIREGLTAIGLLTVMIYMSWRLSLFFLVLGPLIAWLVSNVSKRFRGYAKRIQEAMGEVTSVADESIKAHREIKIFGGQQQAIERFETATKQAMKLNLKVALVQALNSPIIQFIASWSLAAIIFYATQGDAAKDMTAGTFVAFLGSALGLLAPLKALTNVNAAFQRGIAAADDVFTLLAIAPEIDKGNKPLTSTRGDFELRGLRFKYDSAEEEALKGIDLTIASGSTVALVGQSGSGKSTLVNLVARFYNPTGGNIYLDGEDISQYQLLDFRKHIALVNQNITLFNDSIANNIAYGANDEASLEQIEAAAKAANAWEFIQKLPNGLNTQVGENGAMLSGGQRQRIAIARALLKDAPILILDEATSALDSQTERLIQEALERLVKGRTTFIVAHRLSTIENADLIVVMDQGQIMEQGSHAELLAQDGHYAHLQRLQSTQGKTVV